MRLGVWVREAIEPSLLMSFLLVSLGTSVAAWDGFFNLSYYVLCVIGVTLSQNAVNVLNDYHDYKTGVDAATIKTPFSGGSKLLISGEIRPNQALTFGLVSLLLAIPIGGYFVFTRGIMLLAIVAVAGISVLFYTNAFARMYLGEFLAGLNLGPLAVVGAYFVQTTTISAGSIAIGLAPGIMISNVLYLNELPDIEADAAGGRKNIPILLGRRRAAQLYAILETIAVVWIPVAVVLRLIPLPTIIALASLPFATKAIRVTIHQFANSGNMIPALAANVATAYLTILLSAMGYIISVVFKQ